MTDRERTVYVWEEPYVVSVRRKDQGIWIAIGQYMGEPPWARRDWLLSWINVRTRRKETFGP
jgi:hypothetical protein